MQGHSKIKCFAGWLILGCLGLGSCQGTQKAVGPLWVDSAPGGGVSASREYVPVGSVIRHSSPVWVRRPGASAGSRVAYYDKRVRVLGGATVRVGFGGRAELLWPDRATSVVLFANGEARFGDPSLDEPLLALSHLGRAQVTLSDDDQVVLPGGAVLSGDGSPLVGPILADAISNELMRVKNQSKQVCRVRFRGSSFELYGGETIDLPLLLSSRASELGPLLEQVLLGDRVLYLSDGLEAKFDGSSIRVQAAASGVVDLGDFRVRLEAGEQAIFSGLSRAKSQDESNLAQPTQE